MKTKEKLSTKTSFCLTERMLNRVQDAARKNEMSLSKFCRMAILAMLKRSEDFEWIDTNEDTLPGGIHRPIGVVGGMHIEPLSITYAGKEHGVSIDASNSEARIDNIIGSTEDIDTLQTVTPC